MAQQLPLGIGLRPGISFDTFVPGSNAQALASLRGFLRVQQDPFIYLWGEPGVGKTHLLQAACHDADRQGLEAAYVPLEHIEELSPEIFMGLEQLALVCVDDAERIIGDAGWEQGLFHLFNRVRDQGGHLLVSADRSPASLQPALPDLASRLSWGLCYRILPLDEADRRLALMQAAQQRGLQLPEDTADYLLRRCPRDLGSLLALLDRLDRASLAAQRRLTIPFVRGELSD